MVIRGWRRFIMIVALGLAFMFILVLIAFYLL